jgi:hypothetical protein
LVDGESKAARFQILLVARFLLDAKALPKMNSNDMSKRCDAMLRNLHDEDAVESLFLEAVKIVNDMAGHWNRDSIRTEPISKALFRKFGLHYSG